MLKQLIYICCGIAALAAPLHGMTWETEISTALSRAQAEQKSILVDFTGSDWCTWCIKLRQDVLETQAFKEFAQNQFVLLEIDVPQDHRRVGGKAKADENEALCEKYKIRGFPTLMVMSAEGIPLARFSGYRSMSALKPRLDTALQLSNALQAAHQQQGLSKARALLAVYSHLDPQDGAPLLLQIADCDPGNKTGIQEIQQSLDMQNKVDTMLWESRTPDDIQAARKVQDKAIALLPLNLRPRAEAAAQARFANANALMHRSRSKPAAQAKIVRPEPKANPEPELTEADKATMDEITRMFNETGTDVDAQIKLLEDALTKATPAVQYHLKRSLLNVLMYKVTLLGQAARSVNEIFIMKPYMQRIVDLLPPESRATAQKNLDDQFRNPSQTFIQLKMTYGAH